MECRKCKSTRILSVNGKTSDCCVVNYGKLELDGYVPMDLNIGGSDYIEFDLCMECGTHQGEFPVSEETIQEVFEQSQES